MVKCLRISAHMYLVSGNVGLHCFTYANKCFKIESNDQVDNSMSLIPLLCSVKTVTKGKHFFFFKHLQDANRMTCYISLRNRVFFSFSSVYMFVLICPIFSVHLSVCMHELHQTITISGITTISIYQRFKWEWWPFFSFCCSFFVDDRIYILFVLYSVLYRLFICLVPYLWHYLFA